MSTQVTPRLKMSDSGIYDEKSQAANSPFLCCHLHLMRCTTALPTLQVVVITMNRERQMFPPLAPGLFYRAAPTACLLFPPCLVLRYRTQRRRNPACYITDAIKVSLLLDVTLMSCTISQLHRPCSHVITAASLAGWEPAVSQPGSPAA